MTPTTGLSIQEGRDLISLRNELLNEEVLALLLQGLLIGVYAPHQHVRNVIFRGMIESNVLIVAIFRSSNLNRFSLLYRGSQLSKHGFRRGDPGGPGPTVDPGNTLCAGLYKGLAELSPNQAGTLVRGYSRVALPKSEAHNRHDMTMPTVG
jgi:hypothetical protein